MDTRLKMCSYVTQNLQLLAHTCEPAYVVLWLMTTLCIFPNFPKYSCFFRTYSNHKRKETSKISHIKT